MDQTPSATPKQQVVEAIKGATNVLVTVSRSPNVDQLAACIGLTLMLNKLDKHATAVFSGAVPSTIEFLQPEKTIETNTDSLRDFIISLDRAKADKLRYKVEDDVVKIFITPYRTSLSGDDLQFSQGDFNVDVVVALGVDQRDHLDEAIMAHGRILHDAKVVGLSCGKGASDIGGVSWHEDTASSLSEMLVSISESFQSNILDTQMATAFLTGIVAETDRFKNEKTTPKVMTMSAQLMAAGANQQLIATQLAIPDTPPEPEHHTPIAEQPPKQEEAPTLPQPEAEEKPPAPDESFPVSTEDEAGDSPLISLHEQPEEEKPAEEPQKIHEAPTLEELEHQIAIDEEGKLHEHDGDAEASKPKQKVIEPLTMKAPEGPKTDLSKYIFEEPDNAPDFTANTHPENTDTMIDPLANNTAADQNAMPILDHNSPSPQTEEPVLPPLPAESQLPPEPAPQPEPAPAIHVDPPRVELPEEQSTPPVEDPRMPDLNLPVFDPLAAPTPPPDEDAARQAVLSAVNSTDYVPPKADPIAALNAAPMPLDQPMISPSDGKPAPPPDLPPPMLPTDPNVGFPLPGADQNVPPSA